jgi:hypothetical protein
MDGIDASTEQESEALAEQFFSQPPTAWEIDWHAEPMSSLERVAMLTTVAPLMAVLAVAVTLVASELSARAPEPRAVAASMPWVSSVALPAEPVIESAPATAPSAELATEPALVAEAPAITKAARALPVKPAVAAKPANAPLVRARKALSAGDAFFARELAQQAVQDAPDEAAAYIVLAGAYDKLGDRSRMHATFRTCAERAQDKLAEACKSLAR